MGDVLRTQKTPGNGAKPPAEARFGKVASRRNSLPAGGTGCSKLRTFFPNRALRGDPRCRQLGSEKDSVLRKIYAKKNPRLPRVEVKTKEFFTRDAVPTPRPLRIKREEHTPGRCRFFHLNFHPRTGVLRFR